MEKDMKEIEGNQGRSGVDHEESEIKESWRYEIVPMPPETASTIESQEQRRQRWNETNK
jgi:hypothetical protein